MPKHRNGPKAKCSFPLFFFITKSQIPYRPPVNTAKAKDSMDQLGSEEQTAGRHELDISTGQECSRGLEAL